MAKTAEAPRPTKKELDRWAALEQQRLALARRSKSVEALQEKIEAKADAFAKANADKTRVVVTHGYRLELETKRKNAKWKDEYVREKGLDAAEAIIAACETYEKVKIHPPG